MIKTPYGEVISEELVSEMPPSLYVKLSGTRDEDFNHSLLKAYFEKIGKEIPFDHIWTIAQALANEEL